MKNQIKNKKNDRAAYGILAVTTLAAIAINMVPATSFALNVSDPFGDTLCNIANWFTSDTGKAIATIAVIFLGIAAFFGKVTWGLALMFAVGIFAIFGAGEIVQAIAGDEGGGDCTGSGHKDN